MTTAVSLAAITRRFGDVLALDAIDLDIAEGEFFAMLGPSGSGKTTCLRVIAGFEQPSSGELSIFGQRAETVPPYKRNVNTVFQDYALFPNLNVIDNVAYSLMLRKVDRAERYAEAEAALDMVKLAGYGARRPGQLSGGQRQRVALARALVNQPKVLLLDEPLGALDLKLREQMQEELKSLQKRLGITFIFVTHDQEEAMSMSDRIAIMLDGHIEQLADPETVYEHPASAFVAGFVGRNNFWRGRGSADGVVADDGTVFRITRPEEKVAPGEGAIAAVRPECFRLDTSDPGRDVNVLPGVVAGVAHFGDVLQYVVTAGQREILVLTPRAAASRLEMGDNVWCSWSADDVYQFSDRQADLVLPEALAGQESTTSA